MLSRGALGLASPRVRRGLALSWTALFILSLLLQYATFALAPSALAAHNEGIFELDGNALDQAAPGADWENGPEGAAAQFFAGAATEAEANDTTYFTTGGSKDENDIPSWAITSNAVPDKDELTDAYGAIYQVSGETWFYFGADRFDNDGDAQIGFWFFQNKIGIANGDFTGTHADGDILILSEYTNGGVVDLVCAYEWDGAGGGDNIANPGDCDPATDGSHLNLVAAGAECDVADGTFDICAVTNTGTATAPWTFTNKDGEHNFATGQFFEGGINLTAMFGGEPPCFGTFLAETRSSQETDAQLKDFALGSLNSCVPPTIATQVRQDGQSLGSVGTINLGETVTDHATFSGSHGAVTGTADFHVCFNASSTPNCASGGTAVGSDTISGGAADSDAFTPTAVGFYCFRVDYTPDEGSEYLAGSHTNQTTECFQVLPANVTIDKSADDGSVSAGDQIGFTLSWGNSGAGKATGVVVTDTLPDDAGLAWSIESFTGTGSTCAIAAGVLTCNVGSINGNTAVSGTVHIVSDTTADSCGTIANLGHIGSGNDGQADSSDSVTVLCADIDIEKEANPAGPVNPGDPIGFDITVSNTGQGEAKGVHVEDPLPAGVDWTLGAISGDTTGVTCAINGAVDSEVLTCDDASMAFEDSFSVRVTGVMTDTCATIDNTATVTTTNDGSDEASASVGCSVLTIEKSVTGNSNGTLNGVAQAKVGDILTYHLTYTGGGPLTNAVITDPVPDGLEYVDGSALGDANFTFDSYDPATRLLTWTAATLPDPASGEVTFQVEVLEAAAEAPDATTTNVATIDSDETPPDDGSVPIQVVAPPEELTPPPTDVFTPATGTSNPGFALMLILIGVAVVTITIGFVTPVPASRRRDRQG